ncbi:MAG: hypothetical protein PHE70_11845 [Tepidanaerobacteraceae bacterium]|nr:hypothetical protein [Tepidanaerobacteraceae bacterium]
MDGKEAAKVCIKRKIDEEVKKMRKAFYNCISFNASDVYLWDYMFPEWPDKDGYVSFDKVHRGEGDIVTVRFREDDTVFQYENEEIIALIQDCKNIIYKLPSFEIFILMISFLKNKKDIPKEIIENHFMTEETSDEEDDYETNDLYTKARIKEEWNTLFIVYNILGPILKELRNQYERDIEKNLSE